MLLTKSQMKLLLLGVVILAPVPLAHIAFRYWQPERHTNYGELLTPQPLPEDPLRLVGGESFRLADLRGKWILLQLDSGQCGEACQHKLYVMRQVRKAHGRDQDRIERVWLLTDDTVPSAELLQAYQGTWVADASGSTLAQRFPAERAPTEHIYLVDPTGRLMMRFPADGNASRLLKDTQRLLKYSQQR